MGQALPFKTMETPAPEPTPEPVTKNGFRMNPVKKTVNQRLREEMSERDEAIKAALHNAAAAYGNEALTRKKLEAFIGLTLAGRLKWMLSGKFDDVVKGETNG